MEISIFVRIRFFVEVLKNCFMLLFYFIYIGDRVGLLLNNFSGVMFIIFRSGGLILNFFGFMKLVLKWWL